MGDDELAGHLQLLYERLAETGYTTDDRAEVCAFLWLLAERIFDCTDETLWGDLALGHEADYTKVVRG